MLWADYVFIGAMYIQKKSVAQIINRCLKYRVKMVAGGPLFTQEYENYPQVDHFVLNEAEITLPLFLSDLRAGVKRRKSLQNRQIFRSDADTHTGLSSDAIERLCFYEHPGFPRLPVFLRVLRDHRSSGPQDPDEKHLTGY